MNILAKVILIITCLLASTAHGGDVSILSCFNDSTERGNYESKVLQQNGRGEVIVTIDSSGDYATVNYDNRYSVMGKLNKQIESELYIKDFQTHEEKYPFTINRIRLNRHTGNGYFQSST